FFSFFCLHRHLHSFPTRRSSDLLGLVSFQNFKSHGRPFRCPKPQSGKTTRPASRTRQLCNHKTIAATCTWLAPCTRMIISCRSSDRKSTRLNSSHVKISYAVFCL